MIKINPNKAKTLTFDITVEGIDPSILNYTLRLTENGIDYGFNGINKNGEVKVSIPPLNTILQSDRINELKKIKLEIYDATNKYYMKPFEDFIVIESEPDLSITLKEEKDDIVENAIKAVIKEEKDDIVKPEETKTKSKLSKFLG